MQLLPDLDELLALRGAAQGLSLHARRLAAATLQGGHRSAARGRGLEFEEVRLYAAGDDARSIDWRVTARRGKPHTKLFREERERPVWIVADLHPGTFFGSRVQLKSALIVRAAALLGWVAVLGGDRLGAVISDGHSTPRLLPPRARQAGVLPMLESLVECQPRAPGLPAAGHLNQALGALRPLLHPGSLVLILGDFDGIDDRTGPLLGALSAHADCRLLRVQDALEASGLPDGRWRVGVPGRSWWLDGRSSRHIWQDAWRARETQLQQLARQGGLPLQTLDTATPVETALAALLRQQRWAA